MASPDRPDALARLTPFGDRGGLVVMLATLALSFFALGYFLVYWRNADQDLVIVYNALLLNDGRPQLYFEHPAYLTILVTSAWFRLLHAIGYLQAYALSAVPAASNAAAFDAAMTEAIRAGRLLALLTGLGAVAGFAMLMRRIVADWRISLVATFAVAFSGGVAIHLGRLRTELVAAALVVGALMILIPAARQASRWRVALLGLAALLCVLGLANKVHAVLLIAAFPLLLLPFGGEASASVAPWQSFRGAAAPLAALAVAACCALAAAMPLILEGIDASIAGSQIPKFMALPFGVLSAAVALWLAAGVVIFARSWRVSAPETLAACLAIVAGAALGLLALAIQHHPLNSAAVVNPLERMLAYAVRGDAAPGAATFVALLPYDIAGVLARLTFVLGPSSRPAVFLVWLVVPGIVYAWLRGERQLAIQAGALLAVALGIDTLGMRRGLKAEYWVFTDPLIIIAGALLLARFGQWRTHRLAWPIALALAVAHVGVSQSGPVRTAMLRAGPQPVCEWNRHYLPTMPVPFCTP